MKNTILTSLRWLTASRFLAQLVTWALTIFVIRLLSPTDYGLMALASIFIGLFSLIETLGLSAAIVNSEKLEDDEVASIFGFLLLFSAALFGCIFVSAGAIARFFGESELEAILKVLAWRIPIASLTSVPAALLQRAMNFRAKSIVEFAGAIVSSVATLVMALMGFAVWALVYGALILAAINLVGMLVAAGRFYWPKFDFRALRPHLAFGGYVSLDRILWYLSSQADVFFIGKFLGKEVLGVYVVAMQLATLPMQKVSQILNEVGFAAFSRIQADRDDVKRKFVLAVRMVAFIAFPVFFGIAAVSEDIVHAFLGQDWLAVALPLLLLPLTVPLRMLDSITATVLFGIRRPGRAAGNNLIALLLLSPAFFAASYWGDLLTVCLVWLLVYPVYFVIALWRTLPLLGASFAEYFGQIYRFAAFGTAMLLALLAAHTYWPTANTNALFALAAYVAVGVVTYSVLQLAFDSATLKRFMQVVRH